MGSPSAVLGRVRLYSALLAKLGQWTVFTLYRRLFGVPHPQSWSTAKDLAITMMRVLFGVGTYNHWRNFVALMRPSYKVPGLQLEQVPPSTFTSPGFRSSWWVSLQEEEYPQQPSASVVIMYLHGGAFMAGDPLMYQPSYHAWMTGLAALGIKARVFAAGYPLAPEHPFPAGVIGVAEAYQWLVRQLKQEEAGTGASSSSGIIMAGDSAGGNLVLTSLAFLRDQGTNMQQQQQQTGNSNSSSSSHDTAAAAAPAPLQEPLAAVLISPAVDVSSTSVFLRHHYNSGSSKSGSKSGGKSGKSSSSKSGGKVTDDDPFEWDYVSRSEGQSILHEYVGSSDPEQLTNPLISPIYLQDFSGLVQQQLLVIAGGCEGMVSDIRRFVDKLKSSTSGGSSSSSSNLAAAAAASAAAKPPPLLQQQPVVQYHEEPNEPHCCAVLDMGGLVQRGAQVVVPFVANIVRRGYNGASQ